MSTDVYAYDKEKKVISKGVSSVKFLNKKVSAKLYECYHGHKFDSFIGVLKAIDAETGCDDRQLTNLIRVDYFSEFGNAAELLRIYDIYKWFKRGQAKTIKKDKAGSGELCEIIKRHSTDVGANGNELKSYNITDMDGILTECEQYIFNLQIPDIDVRSKIADQLELLGYIDMVTNNPRDRKRLIILEEFGLRGSDGNVWGHAVTVRSIGTGNEARLTIRDSVFQRKPLAKFNVIFSKDLSKNAKGYWYLNDYEILS